MNLWCCIFDLVFEGVDVMRGDVEVILSASVGLLLLFPVISKNELMN